MFRKQIMVVYRMEGASERIGHIKVMRISESRSVYSFEFARDNVQRDIIRHSSMEELIGRLKDRYGIVVLEQREVQQ